MSKSNNRNRNQKPTTPAPVPKVETQAPPVETRPAAVQKPAPPIETQEAPLETRLPGEIDAMAGIRFNEPEAPKPDPKFWPKDTPHPEHYTRTVIPCAKCGRIQLPNGGRAVVVKATDKTIVYLRSKCCNHHWKLELKESRPARRR